MPLRSRTRVGVEQRRRKHVRSLGRPALLLAGLMMVSGAIAAAEQDCADERYVFSWSLTDNCGVKPRGGTSTGAPVTLAEQPSEAWQALRKAGLSKHERDRHAILALAGDYRASFEFLETIGYTKDYERPAPYQSWATERVQVIADTGDFISLQHVMVMYYRSPDSDAVQGPVVMKHWREDWRYQDRDLFVFQGHGDWQHDHLPAEAVAGRWSQAVYQVDDAPRYEAMGRWRHEDNRSIWTSMPTRRPVPRRESTVRDDYDALVGVNRITVLPTGWVHGQDNEKIVLDDANNPQPALAREQGVNRYQRIVDFDFAAGDRYWQKTRAYWAQVRDFWSELETAPGNVHIDKVVDGVPHYAPLFERAGAIRDGEHDDPEANRRFIERTLSAYVDRQPQQP